MKSDINLEKKSDTLKSAGFGKSMPSQVLLGLGVIALGVLFLLDNLGYIDFRVSVRYWPVLVVIWGAVKLLEARSPHERFTFGMITAIGVLLTLSRLGLSFFNLRTLWPVLLIAVGGAVVYKAIDGRRRMGMAAGDDDAIGGAQGEGASGAAGGPGAAGDSVVDITAILGGFDRRLSTPAFRGGEITAIMGGCSLDLRGSSIEGDALLNVFAVMGGITIKCPPDWTVVLQGTPIMGGFEEKTIVPPNSAKRLIIKGYAIMGGVEVRN